MEQYDYDEDFSLNSNTKWSKKTFATKQKGKRKSKEKTDLNGKYTSKHVRISLSKMEKSIEKSTNNSKISNKCNK